VNRNGSTERIIIDKVMQRAPCIAGRATTCWKAHPEGQPETPLVIKDSWQYPERDEEGELLREVADKGVVNVARYYHHETVRIHGEDDDIRNNVRRGLDITQAVNYRPERPMRRSNVASGTSRGDRGRASASRKRSSSQIGAPLPSSKRSCSVSPMKAASIVPNRVHRRLIVRDYGMPIYKASSRSALLAAFERCIEGHESLHRAGLLHRDVSINNLMINEDDDNPSWPAFVIDLDLAIKESREAASGAKGKTGTRAFMAIGALLGEQHSFMHDLESFFWVLFWICIHYDGQGKETGPTEFESWNYESDNKLVRSKVGTIGDESIFLKIADESFNISNTRLGVYRDIRFAKYDTAFSNGEITLDRRVTFEEWYGCDEFLRDPTHKHVQYDVPPFSHNPSDIVWRLIVFDGFMGHGVFAVREYCACVLHYHGSLASSLYACVASYGFWSLSADEEFTSKASR
ncbi:hypothetical protein CEP51_015915, partial [Fusarium floridanum]